MQSAAQDLHLHPVLPEGQDHHPHGREGGQVLLRHSYAADGVDHYLVSLGIICSALLTLIFIA